MIKQAVAHYRGHDLSIQDAASLLDRKDTKYLLPETVLCGCLAGLGGSYTVLEVQGYRQFSYESLYFDTDGLDFYRAHHNGKLNRYKVRLRHYRESRRLFLEVKLKNNKNRTVKRRLELGPESIGDADVPGFLRANLKIPPDLLSPALYIDYDRITLLNSDCTERVTLDTNLRFRSARSGQHAALPGVGIVEIKTNRKATGSAIGAALKAANIRPLRVSKYCTGIALTETVKRNTFKPALQQLERLTTKENSN